LLFVYELDVGDRDHERGFYHGKIQHGRQIMYPAQQRRPTSYYGIDSGAGTVLLHHPRRRAANPAERNLNIGLVGLGVGTLATYGTDGDSMRFYEIDPQVEQVAREYFTYLESSKADVEVVLGDARISMQRELGESGSNNYDVLILDAFSGDSVPVHLLTEEAFDLYAKHLSDGGILAVHITNQYLDLSDIVRTAADRLGMYAIGVEDFGERYYEDVHDWVLIGTNAEFLRSRQLRNHATEWDSDKPQDIFWTDDFSNLFQVIVWE
jgi:hypothetical protein